MVTPRSRRPQAPTRERLLKAGLKLFAAQGYSGTSVGEIETAAGLKPRRGALYRHFKTKRALLEAAVAEHFEAVRRVGIEMQNATATDPRTFALIFGRWMLADMDAQREMTHILEREGNRLKKLRDRFRAGADAGFAAVAMIAEQWAKAARIDLDPKAAAAALLGAVVNFRRSAWTLGAAPLALDDDRFLDGFATLVAALFRPHA